MNMRVRKKPVVVDAMQWNGMNVDDLRKFFGSFLDWRLVNSNYVEIITPEGAHTANPDDWIIKGVEGEFYPCKPNIFIATYEIYDLTEAKP